MRLGHMKPLYFRNTRAFIVATVEKYWMKWPRCRSRGGRSRGVPGVMQIGPMAQDFHAAFGLGAKPMWLAAIDVQGVAPAAIQGLNAKLHRAVDDRDAQIAELKAAIAEVIAGLVKLEARR